jgi:outer membrane protein, multidrug efflux system
MTQKIYWKRVLEKQVRLLSQRLHYYQRLLPQFIQNLFRDLVHRSVIILNIFHAKKQSEQRKTALLNLPSLRETSASQKLQTTNYRLKTLFYCLLLIVAVSCNVTKPYEQPSLTLPQQFNNANSTDTTSIGDIEWRKFFADTTLQGLIDRGVTYNNDLLGAIKRREIAQQRVTQSKYLNLPELNLQLNAQYNRPSNNSLTGISVKSFLGSSHIEYYNILASASWEADIWGKIRGQKAATLAEYLQTYEASRAVQTGIVSDIAQGYYNLLMLDKQLEIARRNLVLSDSFLIATRLLKDAGVVNLLAVEQAESQKQSTALLIPQLEESIALQENDLQLLTGQLPGRVYRNTSLDKVPIPQQLSVGLPVALVSRRPDVRANERALIAASERIGIAKANFYPALNLTVGGGLETFKASNWFSIPNSLFGLAAGSIVQPIFKRKQLQMQYEVAKLEREQAVIQFRQSVLQATHEVTNALVQIQKLKEQETLAIAQVDTLKRAVVNAKLLFKSDLANYLEVITAQGNALQAELNLAAIQRRQLEAVIELYRALGGGWK